MLSLLDQVNPFWLSDLEDFTFPLHFAQGLPDSYIDLLSQGMEAKKQNRKEEASSLWSQAAQEANGADQGLAAHLEALYNPHQHPDQLLSILTQHIHQAPTCAEYRLNRGLVYLRQKRWAEALEDLEETLRINPQFGPVYRPLALLYTLLRRWPLAEVATQQARRFSKPAHQPLLELCSFAAQLEQTKLTETIFNLEAIKPENRPHDHEVLLYLPAINTTPMTYSAEVPFVLFVACDATYFYEHGISFLWSVLAQLPFSSVRPAIHFHIFNPDPQLSSVIEELQQKAAPLEIHTTYEYVNLSAYGAPSIYYSTIRFCRLAQMLHHSQAPVFMVDADVLLHKPLDALQDLLQDPAEWGVCHLPAEPLWNQCAGGFIYFKPTPASQDILTFLSLFITTNLKTGHGRWFLDQVGLYLAFHLFRHTTPPQLLEVDRYLSTTHAPEAVLWAVVNQQKEALNPYNTQKNGLNLRYGTFRENPRGPFNDAQNGKYGWVVLNVHDQFIGQEVQNLGSWCEQEILALASFLKMGDVVVDVGANIGTHTLAFARLVSPQGKVFAFEPQALIYQNLVATVALNSLPYVSCYPVALGKTNGTIEVPQLNPYGAEQNFGGVSLLPSVTEPEHLTLPVPLWRLDDMNLSQCNLLKIDVEGMESDVIEGALETIQRCQPVLYVERQPQQQEAAWVKMLENLGYSIHHHDGQHDFNALCLPAAYRQASQVSKKA